MSLFPEYQLRIIESSEAALRLEAAHEWLLTHAGRGAVIVGASRGAADNLARSVAKMRGGALGLHRFSFTQLAAHLAAPVLASRGAVPVTRVGTEAVAARATFEAQHDHELTYFAPVASTPGFPRALARTLNELALARVGPDALRRLPLGGADLAALFERFDAQFAAASATDRATLFEAATEAADTFSGRPLLMLDVALESSVEFALAQHLIAKAAPALVLVPFGDLATLEYLKALGVEPDVRAPVASSDLTALRRNLFAGRQPPEREPTGEVRVFSAPGEGRECVEIARRILQEARDGTRFDEIAVALRAPAHYVGLLEDAFDRAGIPGWFERGARRPHPGGRAFLAILGCAVERLSALRFAEYLSLGQVPDPEEAARTPEPSVPADDSVTGFARVEPLPDEPEADERAVNTNADVENAVVAGALRAPWRWEKLIVDSAVIGGNPERWRRRLRGLRGEYDEQLREAQREDPESARGRSAGERSRQPRTPDQLRAAGDRDARVVAAGRDLGRVARTVRRSCAPGASTPGTSQAGARRAAADVRDRPGHARRGPQHPGGTAANARRTAAGQPLRLRVRWHAAAAPRAGIQSGVRAVAGRTSVPPDAARRSDVAGRRDAHAARRRPLRSGRPAQERAPDAPAGCGCGHVEAVALLSAARRQRGAPACAVVLHARRHARGDGKNPQS